MPRRPSSIQKQIRNLTKKALKKHGTLAAAHSEGAFPKGLPLPSIRSLLSQHGISVRDVKAEIGREAKRRKPAARQPKRARKARKPELPKKLPVKKAAAKKPARKKAPAKKPVRKKRAQKVVKPKRKPRRRKKKPHFDLRGASGRASAKAQAISALKRSGGDADKAAELLGYSQRQGLHNLAAALGTTYAKLRAEAGLPMPRRTPRKWTKEEFESELTAALEQTNANLKLTAGVMGTSRQYVRKLANKFGTDIAALAKEIRAPAIAEAEARERSRLFYALAKSRGDSKKAAGMLNVSVSNLWKMCRKHGITPIETRKIFQRTRIRRAFIEAGGSPTHASRILGYKRVQKFYKVLKNLEMPIAGLRESTSLARGYGPALSDKAKAMALAERKKELKIVAKNALRKYGNIKRALRAGALPKRFKNTETFYVALNYYGLSISKIRKLYNIPIKSEVKAAKARVPAVAAPIAGAPKPLPKPPAPKPAPPKPKPGKPAPPKPKPAPAAPPAAPKLRPVRGRREIPVQERPFKGSEEYIDMPTKGRINEFLRHPKANQLNRMINTGQVTESRSPSAELLMAVADAARCQVPLILYAFKIDNSVLNGWLRRTKTQSEFGRKARTFGRWRP